MICLRLLYNLSFDAQLRQEMLRVALVPNFVAALSNENTQPASLGVLYNLSTGRYRAALLCTSLHCTALHCTALHCTARMWV